jgi:hypothetical protein
MNKSKRRIIIVLSIVGLFVLIPTIIIILIFLSSQRYPIGYGYYKQGFSGRIIHKSDEYWWTLKYGSSKTELPSDADIKTFEILNDTKVTETDYHCDNDYCICSYAKDNKNAYLNGEIIENADLNSIQYIGSCFAKDKNNIYYYLQPDIILSSDPANFELLTEVYAKDSKYVYFLAYYSNYPNVNDEAIFFIADAETFEYVGEEYYKDKDSVFYENEVIEYADPETFTKVEVNLLRGTSNAINLYRDKNYLYYDGAIVVENTKLEGLLDDLIDIGRNYFALNNKIYYLDTGSSYDCRLGCEFKLVEGLSYSDAFFIEDVPIYNSILAGDRTFVKGEYVKEIDYSTWKKIDNSYEYFEDADSIFYYTTEIISKDQPNNKQFKIKEIEAKDSEYSRLITFGVYGDNVYLHGELCSFLDSKSLIKVKPLEFFDYYEYDGDIYYNCIKQDGLVSDDMTRIEGFGEYYYSDGNVFVGGNIIEDVDLENFTYIGDGYTKYNDDVYYNGIFVITSAVFEQIQIEQELPCASMRIVRNTEGNGGYLYSYYYDGENYYCEGEILERSK